MITRNKNTQLEMCIIGYPCDPNNEAEYMLQAARVHKIEAVLYYQQYVIQIQSSVIYLITDSDIPNTKTDVQKQG